VGKLEVARERLADFHVLTKELVNNACHEALFAVGYTTNDSNFFKQQTKGHGFRDSKDGRRMPYLEQAKKRKFCVRLSW
jgi:hypothetical protein